MPSKIRSASTLNISTSVTLRPGLYIGGINIIGSANVVLMPGLYYLQGGGFSVGGQATVTDNGLGVMLYNAPTRSGGDITFAGQANVSLTGMSAARPDDAGPQCGLRGTGDFPESGLDRRHQSDWPGVR